MRYDQQSTVAATIIWYTNDHGKPAAATVTSHPTLLAVEPAVYQQIFAVATATRGDFG